MITHTHLQQRFRLGRALPVVPSVPSLHGTGRNWISLFYQHLSVLSIQQLVANDNSDKIQDPAGYVKWQGAAEISAGSLTCFRIDKTAKSDDPLRHVCLPLRPPVHPDGATRLRLDEFS